MFIESKTLHSWCDGYSSLCTLPGARSTFLQGEALSLLAVILRLPHEHGTASVAALQDGGHLADITSVAADIAAGAGADKQQRQVDMLKAICTIMQSLERMLSKPASPVSQQAGLVAMLGQGPAAKVSACIQQGLAGASPKVSKLSYVGPLLYLHGMHRI